MISLTKNNLNIMKNKNFESQSTMSKYPATPRQNDQVNINLNHNNVSHTGKLKVNA